MDATSLLKNSMAIPRQDIWQISYTALSIGDLMRSPKPRVLRPQRRGRGLEDFSITDYQEVNRSRMTRFQTLKPVIVLPFLVLQLDFETFHYGSNLW